MNENNKLKVVISEQMFNYVQPILVISRTLGLLPVKYEKIGERYILTISYVYVIYSYVFGIILAGSALLGLVRDLKASPEYSLRIKDTKGAYVVSFDLGFMILIVILGIFISPFKIDKFFLILDSLNQVHLRLPFSDKQNQRKSSLYMSLASYSIFIGVLTFDFIGWCIQTHEKPSSNRLWHNIPVYILYVVSWTQEICFWHMTYFVKNCVTAFGECFFLDNGKVGKMKLTGTWKNVISKERSSTQKVFSVENMGKMNASNFMGRNVFTFTTEQTQMFINVHRTLYGAVNSINDWYGIPLMLILLSCFIQLIGTPYFMLSNTAEKALVFSVLEVIWLFTHASRLMIIVESSYRCVREFEKINYILCQHLERNYDYETMHKLKQLAVQIDICKVKFSTCGIANINRSILSSITGSVTTYLVILVQLNDDSFPALAELTTTETTTLNHSI